MIYVLRLVTGDEVVCELEALDMSSDELVIQDPMEIVSSENGSMYLRSMLMLSNDDYLVIPTTKIVYSYTPSKSLVRYYNLSVKMYYDHVMPVVDKQIAKSAQTIEDAYKDEIQDDGTEQAMDLLRGLLKKYDKRDLN